MTIWHWLLHVTGADNVSGPWYGFWSGFGSDLGEMAIVGAVVRMVNCHAKGCWRVGLHHVAGTGFKVCGKHHPTNGNSAEHIAAAHTKASS